MNLGEFFAGFYEPSTEPVRCKKWKCFTFDPRHDENTQQRRQENMYTIWKQTWKIDFFEQFFKKNPKRS